MAQLEILRRLLFHLVRVDRAMLDDKQPTQLCQLVRLCALSNLKPKVARYAIT
jgi:hypothetical protein